MYDLDKVDYLNQAELYLEGIKRYHPTSSEVGRLSSVVAVMHSELNETEGAKYSAIKNFVESTAEKAARLKADIDQMMSNKDSQSI